MEAAHPVEGTYSGLYEDDGVLTTPVVHTMPRIQDTTDRIRSVTSTQRTVEQRPGQVHAIAVIAKVREQ